MNQKLSTDLLFEEIEKNGEVDPDKIEFAQKEPILLDLHNRIIAIPMSVNKFANSCGIQPSHLHEFLNGTKNLGRDKLIVVCIMLGMNIKETRTVLKCLLQSDLYPKNQRDYEIMCAIRQGKPLDDINDLLYSKGLSTL